MSCPDEPIFIKQQGAMRTGTNLVKFALEENFTNVRVLVNIGRWKHATADTPFNWRGENWEGDSRNVDVPSRIDEGELEKVRSAFGEGVVKYAVSVRNIYCWLESYLSFIATDDSRALPITKFSTDQIIEALQRWNATYRSYLSLFADENQAMLFRMEDLIEDYTATLNRARLLWGLKPRHARYVKPARYLRAGIDGQIGPERFESDDVFNHEQYLRDINDHMARLDNPLLDLIRRNIDGAVLKTYGYEIM